MRNTILPPASASPSATGKPDIPPARMRVLWVINSLAGGGAERVFSSLINASMQYRDRYDIDVALLDDDVEIYGLPDGISVHRLDCRYGLLRSVVRLNELAHRLRPDVTLSFLTRSNLAAAAAMLWRGRPFVISERVNTTAHLLTGRLGRASRAMVKLAYPRAARIIAVSEGVADTLVDDYAVAADRIRVVPNPVDLESIQRQCRSAPEIAVHPGDVVAMGRLVENKNFSLAVRAFARARDSGRLILLGEGPLRAELRKLGDDLGLADRLVMPGFVKNPYAVISRCEFLVLSSNAEGFSNALVEALACGVPVVATDCRSSPAEILDVTSRPDALGVASGKGGLLVPTNDEAAMVSAIEMLAEPESRSQLSRIGMERVSEFGVAAAVERYWQVLAETLPRRDWKTASI